MTPTPELREKLRRLIDEVIPAGGADTDTRFTDTELDEILTESNYIEEAAAECWERKAARAMSERGGLEEARVGDESHRFVSLREYRDHCLAMAARFRARIPRSGSLLLAFEPPDVLGTAPGEMGP